MPKVLVGTERHTSTVTVLLMPELRRRIEEAAVRNERSIGAECRVALKRHLDRDEEEGDG